MIGSLGNIVLEASADLVRTWHSASRTGKARWARHEVLGRKPLLEHTGPDLETFELSIRLDAGLGLNPSAELDALRAMRDNAEPQVLTLGGRVHGYFVLENLSETMRNTDARGRITLAEASLSLVEYVEDAASEEWRGYGARGLDDFALSSMFSGGNASGLFGLGGSALDFGNFSLSGLLPGTAEAVLSQVRVADILGRIPGLPSFPGMGTGPRAIIGSVLSGLPVPSDFAAGGASAVFSSLQLGGAVAPADLTRAYGRMGLAPDAVAGAWALDAPSALRLVSQRAVALPTDYRTEALAALAGQAASGYMGQAVNGFAQRL